MVAYTDKQKEEIWVKRTQEQYPDVWRYYMDLVESEKLSRDETLSRNFKKRQEMVLYAYNNTKFYRGFYDRHGVRPEDIKTEDDWDALPILTKDMVREHAEEMIVESARPYAKLSTTSGSTGKPLSVYVDKQYYCAPCMEWWVRGIWMQRPLGKPVGPSPILGLNEAWIDRIRGVGRSTAEQLKEAAKRTYPMRRFWLDAQSMTVDAMRRFMDEIGTEESVHLYGYTGGMQNLAERILNGDVDCKFRPVTLAVAASVLTKSMRQTMNSAFGTHVHDLYGCNEIGRMATEGADGDGSLYVFENVRHLDLITEDGDSIHDEREGRVVMTSLNTRVMPFIKYKLGDRTHFIGDGGGANGLPFQRVAGIGGREDDYLVCRDGSCIYGPSAAFDDCPECALSYRFVEHSPGVVTLCVVPNVVYPRYKEAIENIRSTWEKMPEERLRLMLSL